MIPSITISNAHLAYAGQPVFSNLNLDIPAGKWVALLGTSGTGKSSLLRLLAGLTQPEEKSSASIVTDNAQPLQEQIAYMAQTDLLLPWFNVLANVTLGFRLRGQMSKEVEKHALSLLARVDLSEAARLYPRQLSGGMRQRAALVRTLMEDKPVVLMDEPFSSLDAITRYKLHELAAELLNGKSVLFITHDPLEALRIANEIYLMQPFPAPLKHILSMPSPRVRNLSDPVIIKNQQVLYEQLGSQ